MSSATDSVQESQMLDLFDDAGRIDRPAVERAIRSLFVALGQDVIEAGSSATQAELADAYEALLESETMQIQAICLPDGDHDLVVSAIPFSLLCRHLFPLHGVVHIGYLPEQLMLGVSELSDVVDHFSHRLQTSIHLARRIVEWSEQHLRPRGIAVLVEVQDQYCIAGCGTPMRSPKTAALVARGALRDDPWRRDEFISLAERGQSTARRRRTPFDRP